MIRFLFTSFFTLFLFLASSTICFSKPMVKPSSNNTQLLFIENAGQITDQHYQPRADIDFRISANGVNLFVGSSAMHYQWAKPIGTKVIGEDTLQEYTTYRMDVKLLGANPNAQITKEDKQNFYERYYTPQFNEQGGKAYSYQKITYKEVYPNIDWVLYIKGNTVEYDFIVRPDGNVADIRLQYLGTNKLSINKDCSLTATTPFGTVTEAAPISFQQADGKAVSSKFILENDILSFSTGDYKGTLVIDPVLEWATYYGGSMKETIAYGSVGGDTMGNFYFAGTTISINNIATSGSFMDTFSGQTDAFIFRLNENGSVLWGTYFGGTWNDVGNATTCDNSGYVYLCGHSNSENLATKGSHQTKISGGSDAFLAKFDSLGSLYWATYYGGTGTEQGNGLACDLNKNIYLTGQTQSSDNIASPLSHQTTHGGNNDVFIVKFNNFGTRLWSTYYGGSGNDIGIAITCNKKNDVYLSGYTRSTTSIATIGSHQDSWAGNDDAFLVKLDSMGNRLWGTYFGSTGSERSVSIASDKSGVYMVGNTNSTASISTPGSYQEIYGGGANDGYIVKFNENGIRLWGTYFGGTANDNLAGICSDGIDNLYVVGLTASTTNIASLGSLKDTFSGGNDAIIAKFDITGNRIWSSYYGGESTDPGYGVFCNSNSKVLLGGQTKSLSGISTTGSHQEVLGGDNDGYLALFNDCNLINPTEINGNDTVCRRANYTYTIPPVSGAISYTWALPLGWTGTSTTNSIDITADSETDTITVTANFNCGSSAAIEKVIHIMSLPEITTTGNTEICLGDTITLTSNTSANYQWLKDNAIISGATTSSFTASESGNYTVIVTNNLGCYDTSLAFKLTVHSLPIPVISKAENTLSTTAYKSYQWNLNGTPITGAIHQTYDIVVEDGAYTVTVTDNNECAGTSEAFNPSTDIHHLSETDRHISVYPNPFYEYIIIDTKEQIIKATIYAIDGRKIADHEGEDRINLQGLSDGIYLLKIYDKNNQEIRVEKIIKSKIQ